jgi:hypothetical protein
MQLRKLNMGLITNKEKRKLMKINTLDINVRFINGSKQLIIKLILSYNIQDNVTKEKLEAWTSRTSLGKEIDVNKTISRFQEHFLNPHYKLFWQLLSYTLQKQEKERQM